MADYETVIRNTTIATASDVVKGDIGIVRGRVVALGEHLDKGQKEIDATGPDRRAGGIDAHVHFRPGHRRRFGIRRRFRERQPGGRGRRHHDHHPFAYQSKGQPLRDAVNKYHKRAEGKSLIDYAFHVILSDASEKIMGQISPPWSPTLHVFKST